MKNVDCKKLYEDALWILGIVVLFLFGVALLSLDSSADSVTSVITAFIFIRLIAFLVVSWLILFFFRFMIFPAEESYNQLGEDEKKKARSFAGKVMRLILSILKERQDKIGKISVKIEEVFL